MLISVSSNRQDVSLKLDFKKQQHRNFRYLQPMSLVFQGKLSYNALSTHMGSVCSGYSVRVVCFSVSSVQHKSYQIKTQNKVRFDIRFSSVFENSTKVFFLILLKFWINSVSSVRNLISSISMVCVYFFFVIEENRSNRLPNRIPNYFR